jgi:hypothetical protein
LLIIEINDTGSNFFGEATVDTTTCIFANMLSDTAIQKNVFQIKGLPNHGGGNTTYFQDNFIDSQVISLSASGYGLQIIQSMKNSSHKPGELFYYIVGINTSYINGVLISHTRR